MTLQVDTCMSSMFMQTLQHNSSLLIGIAVGGLFVGFFGLILGIRLRRVSLSKQTPAFLFCFVTWSLSIVAAAPGALSTTRHIDREIAILSGLVSALLLGLMLLEPVMHRKSGFHPAVLRMRLRGLGWKHPMVLQGLREFFLQNGFELFDAGRLGYTFRAVPSIKNVPSWNRHIGQIRVFVKVECDSSNIDIEALVDTMAYVMRDTWETPTTRLVLARVEQFVREKYADAVVTEI
jgi:hypothetical protein